MSDRWDILAMYSFAKDAKKTHMGFANSEDEAKGFAKSIGENYLLGHSVAEINGQWCVQGQDPANDKIMYVIYQHGTGKT